MSSDPLKNPDNAKDSAKIMQMPSPSSLAAIQTPEQLEAEIERGKRALDAGQQDPVAAALLNKSTRTMSVAATSDMFAKGDRVYHKRRKQEGTVKEVSSSGVRMKFANGEKHWVKPENLVKL